MSGQTPAVTAPEFDDPQWLAAWRELDCRLAGVQPVFEAAIPSILERLTPAQQHGLWGAGRQLGKLGRGAAPVQAWLMHWPEVLVLMNARGDEEAQGNELLNAVLALVHAMHKSPNSAAIAPLLGSLATVARRLGSVESVRHYLLLVQQLMQQTTGSIHGRQQTLPSPGLVPLLEQVPRLLQLLSLAGLRRWVEHGARVHSQHPQHQADYFGLVSPDSISMMQRQRHGTLLVDVQRTLGLSLQALWGWDLPLVPQTSEDAGAHRTAPGLQKHSEHSALGLPDVLEPLNGVDALTRYRLMLLHAAGHQAWSGQCVADNWSPAQRLAVEAFEDARIDRLLLARWPGLSQPMLALLPPVQEGACDETQFACLRHRLAVFTRAVLDTRFVLQDPLIKDFVDEFEVALAADAAGSASLDPDADSARHATQIMASMALRFVARTRRQSDQQALVFFQGTQLDWRDDNRHLWRFIEDGDEEDTHASPRTEAPHELHSLPPRLYPEWDHHSQSERPDWVKVYEYLHPAGHAGEVDQLLARHSGLTRRLQRVLDRLKPQGRERLRRLEQGSELDLDLAQQALMDLRSGHSPRERVQQHWRTNQREVSVQLVMDLSASLSERVQGSEQTVLQVSQAAVAILGWTLQQLGDALAIGGFHSNSRQEVRYMHLKGFGEDWGHEVKARLAAITPAWSTRLGAALRHGARPLVQRKSPRKLLLVLTDGEPSDVDVSDPDYLAQDARYVVRELQAQGVFVWCIQLHPAHEVSVRTVFGEHYTLVDNIEQLPQTLAALFLRLTR